MAAYKDYYQILGLPRDAEEKQIRAAFRKLAAKHHPDRNRDDPQAEERFKEVNEAYTVLSDPEKRRIFDQFGHTGAPPPFTTAPGGRTVFTTVDAEDAAGFSDFFRTLFGGFAPSGDFADVGDYVRAAPRGFAGRRAGGDHFGGFGPRTAAPPAGAEATLQVSLEEAFHGGVKTVRVGPNTLDVTIPAGVRNGARLRLRGQAPDGGDLILKVAHRRHPRYRIDGDTVHVRVDVPDHVAVLGGEVRVPTLDGDVELRIPEHTQTGRRLRLRGRGWPRAGGERGDAQAEIRVVVPERPGAEQEALYRRLRELAAAEERGGA